MPFAPTDLSNLHVWYKADAITGLNDGDGVGTWPDSSGNGFDATQGTAGNKPLYKTNIQNGLPTVRFDGTDDFLQSSPSTATQPVTIFFVASVTSTSGEDQFFHAGIEAFDNTAGTGMGFWGGSGGVVEPQIQPLTMSVMGGLLNGGSTTWRRAGVQRATGDSGTASFAATCHIGRHASIGTRYIQGDIAELIVWDANHSASQNSIETYLGDKWGLVPRSTGPAPRRRWRLNPGLVYR